MKMCDKCRRGNRVADLNLSDPVKTKYMNVYHLEEI